jgi:hypothetical protein
MSDCCSFGCRSALDIHINQRTPEVNVGDAPIKMKTRTVYREPAKHGAGLEPSLDFVDPLIVEIHPLGSALDAQPTWLDTLPEKWVIEIADGTQGIETPPATGGESKEAEGGCEDGAGGRGARVPVPSEEEDNWAEKKDDGGEGEGKIESDVLYTKGGWIRDNETMRGELPSLRRSLQFGRREHRC